MLTTPPIHYFPTVRCAALNLVMVAALFFGALLPAHASVDTAARCDGAWVPITSSELQVWASAIIPKSRGLVVSRSRMIWCESSKPVKDSIVALSARPNRWAALIDGTKVVPVVSWNTDEYVVPAPTAFQRPAKLLRRRVLSAYTTPYGNGSVAVWRSGTSAGIAFNSAELGNPCTVSGRVIHEVLRVEGSCVAAGSFTFARDSKKVIAELKGSTIQLDPVQALPEGTYRVRSDVDGRWWVLEVTGLQWQIPGLCGGAQASVVVESSEAIRIGLATISAPSEPGDGCSSPAAAKVVHVETIQISSDGLVALTTTIGEHFWLEPVG